MKKLTKIYIVIGIYLFLSLSFLYIIYYGDGYYYATIDYYNYNTEYSATYQNMKVYIEYDKIVAMKLGGNWLTDEEHHSYEWYGGELDGENYTDVSIDIDKLYSIELEKKVIYPFISRIIITLIVISLITLYIIWRILKSK